jgi:hypothetical protein
MPDQPVIFGRISIDPLPNWALFPLEKQIVARPATRVGGLTISTAMLDKAPRVQSHVESLRLASQVLATEGIGPSYHFERISWAPCFRGAASFNGKTDFYRIWYIHEGTSLVTALYACKLDRSQCAEAARELIDCRRLASSIAIKQVE